MGDTVSVAGTSNLMIYSYEAFKLIYTLTSAKRWPSPPCRHGCPSAVDYNKLIERAWHCTPQT